MSLMTFLKKPSVMLALGVIGFFGTNVLTARATIKFIKEKQALNRDTTLKEDIVLGVKCYGTAATAGAVSTALIFGGNKSYATAQAGLVTGYTLLNTKYKNYRDAALKVVGLDKFKEIDKQLVNDIHEKPENYSKFIPEVKSQGTILLMDPFSDPKNPVFTETTLEQYEHAKNEFNRRIVTNPRSDIIIPINEWRDLNSFDDQDIRGEEYGYSQEYLEDVIGHLWVDIDEEIRFDAAGNMYYYPIFRVDPCVGNSQQKHFL